MLVLARGQPGRPGPGVPDRHRHRDPDDDRDHLVPPDGAGVPSGGGAYIVRGRTSARCPAWSRRPPSSSTTCSPCRSRSPPACSPSPRPCPSSADARVLLALGFVASDHPGEPSGGPGVRHAVRRPDVRVHRRDLHHDRHGAHPVSVGVPGGGRSARRDRPDDGATVGLWVILRAFSSGSTALTGVEAISNGVPAFRRPQSRNAAETLTLMGVIAISMFLGISWLATHIEGILPSHERVGRVADRQRRVRRRPRLLPGAGVHGGDPDPGRQHRLPGFPAAVGDPGPGQLRSPSVPEPRGPAGVLQRGRSSWPPWPAC